MLPIQYTYLFGASLFIIPWVFIFTLRKDLRGLLIQIGFLFTILGLIGEYFWWTKDWWRPYTITNTVIGIEDIILGFTCSGIAATLYLIIFKKKFKQKRVVSRKRIVLIFLIIIGNIALFSLLFALHINSFIATLITAACASALVLWQKKDLLIPAFLSGLLMMVIVLPIYIAMIFVTPAFVEKTWLLGNLSGINVVGVPIEDFIFYFVTGVFCFSVFPYYNDAKLSVY